MTFGEILALVEYHNKTEEAKAKAELQNLAFNAFWGGYYSRPNVRMPQTVLKAFPYLFDRTDDGAIKAEHWQESKAALVAWADRFNSDKKQKAVKK